MIQSSTKNIVLYTSKWCPQSRSVESLLRKNGVPVIKITIDGNSEAREELIRINNGFASVPTLIFPDGTTLTEPSYSELSKHLALEPPPSLMERVRGLFGQKGKEA